MSKKYLDLAGLAVLLGGIKGKFDEGLATKLDKDATAVAAHKLETAVKIAGVEFDGTKDIVIPAGNVGAYTKGEADELLATKVDKVEGKGLSEHDFTDALKLKLEGIEEGANLYVHPETHDATMIVQDENHRFVTDAEKAVWGDKYTKVETDNLLSAAISGISWKSAVETFEDIAITYPEPQDGWTVNVNDTDITYRYTGSEWIAISANAIPLASADVDGKMSKENFIKLAGIEENANLYVHPETHDATMIVQDETHRFVTDIEKAKWNDKYTVEETDAMLATKLNIEDVLVEDDILAALEEAFAPSTK